jgi:signal transduction histidine kinase/ligand-binding sensor domain-containing protein/ActR/RegA family two-component response regulator
MNCLKLVRARAAAILVILFLAVLASPTFAIDPEKTVTQFGLDVWQIEQGLPQNSVRAITQTTDGYLWLGTEEGFVRFDGVRFTVFDRRNAKDLKDKVIRELFAGRDGSLWIGTVSGGLSHLKDGQLTTYTTDQGLLPGGVVSIVEGNDGSLWIGVYGGGINRLKGGTLSSYTAKDGLASNNVDCVLMDRGGDLWIGTDDRGLDRLHDGRFTHYGKKEGLPNGPIAALREDRESNLWVAIDGGGLSRFKDGRFTTFTTRHGLSSNSVLCILEDREGSIWLGTDDGGVTRMRDGSFSSMTTRHGLTSGVVRALYEDREGSIWIGTDGGGLNRLRDGKFVSYTTNEGLSHNQARPVCEGGDGSLWIGTRGGGLNRLKDGKLQSYTTRQGLSDNYVTAICPDPDGSLWVGTVQGGIDRFRNGKFTSYSTKGSFSADVRSLLVDRKGNLWVGTYGDGLRRLKDGKMTLDESVPSLQSGIIRSLVEGRDGSIWVGADSGLYRLNGGHLSSYSTAAGLSSNIIYSIYEDQDGVLWVGTSGGGLNRLKDGRFTSYTMEEGLFDDLIFAILEDDAQNLWMSSNKGIFRVRKRELDNFAAGRVNKIASVSFGMHDGMKSSECNGGSHPAGWKSRDGRLWFPTIRGVVTTDPATMSMNYLPPPVWIEGALINQNAIAITPKTPLPPGDGDLEFHYTALSLVNPDRVRFKYQLEGFDRDWVDADTSRVAHYTNIPPGAYRFRVKACNNDGVWNETGASFEFFLEPFFYQTGLFYVLCGLAAVLAAFGIHGLRVRHLKAHEVELALRVSERTAELRQEVIERQRAEAEMERGKLAAEAATHSKSEFLANMSHEIRTPMNGILGMTELALELSANEEQREYLVLARSSAESLMTIINDILDFSKIEAGKLDLDQVDFNLRRSLDDVISIMAVSGRERGISLGRDVSRDVPETIIGDPGRLRQILVNLVGNALKFTEKGEVLVRVETESLTEEHVCLRFTVKDTGIGIPPDKQQTIFQAFTQADGSTTRKYGGSGLGLAISSQLVNLMAGRITVESECGKGSAFAFTASFKRTYAALLASAPDSKLLTSANHEEQLTGTPLRILLAEDNLVNQRLARRVLEKRGHSVEVATTGTQAISILARQSFDLVLMDVQMPEMNGLEATAAIRKKELGDDSHIPIIAMTAHAMKGDRERCLQAGMDGYLTKPLKVAELYEAMDRATGKRAFSEQQFDNTA